MARLGRPLADSTRCWILLAPLMSSQTRTTADR
jgi:hypothetical protein